MQQSEFLLEARSISKAFDGNPVLTAVDLAVPTGSVVCIIGKSGVGKSVLLKCLAGILSADSGEILFEGRAMKTTGGAAQAEFRGRCSYLFQHNALLDSLTAIQNVALPLEQRRGSRRRDFIQKSRDMLQRLELDDFRTRFPGELSGGMQKRLALARALVTEPQLVLFDEPTAGLDPVRRNSVFSMIARYQRELGFTAIVVTHDLPEALVVSDRVAFLDGGSIRFSGSPDDFSTCMDPAVAGFRDSVANLRNEVAAAQSEPLE
jgi:phospholipid/cholesterol/gamma-HCH transport system ATP-binding protein